MDERNLGYSCVFQVAPRAFMYVATTTKKTNDLYFFNAAVCEETLSCKAPARGDHTWEGEVTQDLSSHYCIALKPAPNALL